MFKSPASMIGPTHCVVCHKDRVKLDANWQGLPGALPLGSQVCSDECFQRARQRIAINGRADKPVEGEPETPAETAPTQPPASTEG